jgi:ABC-type transport system involved in multi-copper enzyme maturation permease subunit
MLGITDYLWRLIPGNPILLRVVEAAGKKRRDLFIRCGYLALLVAIVLWIVLGSGDSYSGNVNLATLTKESANLFKDMSYLQLGLVALLSPIFTAGAITQEKDSQTYDILLATPLTNGQIVLGSLMSRVFFVVALLISGIPIFSVTQIFGGVAIRSIIFSFLIAASTALVTGAMAMAIATFKIGTRRTIFSFYLFIVMYLVGIYLLDRLDFFHLNYIDASGNSYRSQTSWLTGIHPFLALQVMFNDKNYTPPDLGGLPPAYQTWPIGWYLSSPASFYFCFMTFLSFAMVLPSILLLRRMAQSTSSFKTWAMQKLHLGTGDRTRKPRTVWYNPIAWREARTKASAARASVLRYGFILLGLAGAVVLLVMHSTETLPHQYTGSYDPVKYRLFINGDKKQDLAVAPGATVKIDNRTGAMDDLAGKYEVISYQQDPSNAITEINLAEFPRQLSSHETRTWLLGITIIEFSVILLIISNAAASTVTREKEDGTLDLLLTTPITSRYYIWGKLRGLVSFVLPLIAVLAVSAFLFIAHDLLRWLAMGDKSFDWVVVPEALIMLPTMLVIICAFAAILGMQMSLRCRTTVRAVMSSVGIIVGVCALLGWCGFNVLTNSGNFPPEAAVGVGVFSPFTLMTLLIDPWDYGGRAYDTQQNDFDPTGARWTAFIVCLISLGVYALVVWTMYKSMVKNFDMTIRKQSR